MIGTGTTITFASGFFAEILDLRPPAPERESIQTSHFGTTDTHTFVPATLVDWGECQVDLKFDPSTSIPIDSDAETITIDFADGSSWAFNGFMTKAEPSVPFEEEASMSCTLKVSGDVTISPAT